MSVSAFGDYLANEIAKPEQLLEDAYDLSDATRIENNVMVVESLREVTYAFNNRLRIKFYY